MVKLFGSLTSPFVRHCRIAFLEQNTAFEFVACDYAKSAADSPAKKVPFLEYDGGMLIDSSAILQWIRKQGNRPFMATPEETNFYCLANTVLDTAINLYLLEKDGLTPAQVPYLRRQQSRVESCLQALENENLDFDETPNDAQWRLACLMEWARYRQRFDFKNYDRLQAFFQTVSQLPVFRETTPPPA